MRGLLAIVVGFGFLALAAGMFPLGKDQPPLAINIFVGILGGIAVLAGFAHLRLRWKRYHAYRGGIERHGTVRLERQPSSEGLAYLTFSTSYQEWIMSVDPASIDRLLDQLEDGLEGKAYLGTDDRIYGLDIGNVKSLPISAGVPLSRKMREKIDRVERRMREMAGDDADRKGDQKV